MYTMYMWGFSLGAPWGRRFSSLDFLACRRIDSVTRTLKPLHSGHRPSEGVRLALSDRGRLCSRLSLCGCNLRVPANLGEPPPPGRTLRKSPHRHRQGARTGCATAQARGVYCLLSGTLRHKQPATRRVNRRRLRGIPIGCATPQTVSVSSVRMGT